MKAFKIIAASMMLLCAASTAFAKSDKTSKVQIPDQTWDEFALTYGRVSIPAFAMNFGAVLGMVITVGNMEIKDVKSTGAIGFDYHHYFNNHFAVGCSTVFENIDMVLVNKSNEERASSDLFISVLPGIKWRWLYREHFGMYTKAGVGVLLQPANPAGEQLSLGIQLSPVGMEFGGVNFRGFLEAGFGDQGILMAGLRYAF